jgi:hypothetical protein
MTIIEQIYWVIILSMVVACISWTVTQEEIFREWHDRFEEKSRTSRTLLQRKVFYVFTCEYCFSHWVTILIIVFTGFRVLIDDWRGYVLAFFLLAWIANLWMSFYRRLRVDIKHENELAKKLEHENEDGT